MKAQTNISVVLFIVLRKIRKRSEGVQYRYVNSPFPLSSDHNECHNISNETQRYIQYIIYIFYIYIINIYTIITTHPRYQAHMYIYINKFALCLQQVQQEIYARCDKCRHDLLLV